jgi:rare lipoprotein A
MMSTQKDLSPRAVLPLILCVVLLAHPRPLTAQTRDVGKASVASSGGQEGLASYYANRRHGRRTASGETFDNEALVAAHPSLAFGTRVRVTNLGNGRVVEVRIVDRGPAEARQKEGYVIDLSRAAASRLGFVKQGHSRVRLEVVGGVKK